MNKEEELFLEDEESTNNSLCFIGKKERRVREGESLGVTCSARINKRLILLNI